MINSRVINRIDSEILNIARMQHGVVSSRQLHELGLTDAQIRWRMNRAGCRRELPGVWRMSWSDGSWMQKVWAATLWAGCDAVISHHAAARLWGLEVHRTDEVHVTSCQQLRARVPWMVTHRRQPIAQRDQRSRYGLRVTSPTRTAVDLAAMLPEGDLEGLIEDALRRKLATVGELRRALAWAPARTPGSKALGGILDRGEWSPQSQSELERKALELFRRARLPAPQCQFTITDGIYHLATVDFAWPAAKLVVEAEGFQFHSGRRAWERDLARYNSLLVLGWRVLRLSWKDVHSKAEEFIAAVAHALKPQSVPDHQPAASAEGGTAPPRARPTSG